MRDGVVSSALELIGHTPMVEMNRVEKPAGIRLLAKVESLNPGGSVKDRVALAMVDEAEAKGLLRPGDTIVEPTSGNTGIGLAMVAAIKGYRLILTMPEDMSVERRTLLSLYGADLILTPAIQGMSGAVRTAEELARAHGYYMPQQFTNPANPAIHRCTTAQEILRQTGGKLDAFVAGIGTGGTLSGVATALKERVPAVRIVAVEPQRSAVLSGRARGAHRIQGIGPGFVPDVLDTSLIDQVVAIGDEEAYDGMREIVSKEGLLVGISSGANLRAAVRTASELAPGSTVVTILPDTGERYLSLAQTFR